MEKHTIALLTDFGSSDFYAGTMKGVIAGIAPDANIIDLSHNILAQNIKQAAFILASSYHYFEEGSIFMVVVDPGVGTSRKPVCIKIDGRYFVGPDNGFISYILMNQDIEAAVLLNNESFFLPEITHTFHGRDIFSPVAAHLANGTSIYELGTEINPAGLVKLENLKYIDKKSEMIRGEVLYIDSFGNLITSINGNFLKREEEKLNCKWLFSFANHEISVLSKTFEDVAPGEFLAYIGSSGFLAIAKREANAAASIDAYVGMKIKATKVFGPDS